MSTLVELLLIKDERLKDKINVQITRRHISKTGTVLSKLMK
jgi:hypothetical protein